MSPLESGEWTWGELLGVVEADQERQRRLLQNQALIAWGQAAVTAVMDSASRVV